MDSTVWTAILAFFVGLGPIPTILGLATAVTGYLLVMSNRRYDAMVAQKDARYDAQAAQHAAQLAAMAATIDTAHQQIAEVTKDFNASTKDMAEVNVTVSQTLTNLAREVKDILNDRGPRGR